jgi:hypothetical protein
MFVMVIELCVTDPKLILVDLDCQEFETKKITLFVMQSSIFQNIPRHNFQFRLTCKVNRQCKIAPTRGNYIYLENGFPITFLFQKYQKGYMDKTLNWIM